jgi:ATP synthase protein I
MLKQPKGSSDFGDKVGAIADRKSHAQKQGIQSVWRGLGMFGIVGWSISIPTLLGILIGVTLDAHFPSVHSWTLTMLFVGLMVGCLNAWHWISAEQNAINDEERRR